MVGKKLDTKVSVGKIHLGLLNRIIIDDFELYDQQSELMLKSSRLAAKIDYGELIRNGRVYISSAQLFGLKGVFYKQNGQTKPNFQFVLDSLASKDKKKKSDLELSVNSLIIRHGAIKYDRYDIAPTPSKFNISHIDVKDISAHLIMPYYTADSVEVDVKKLSLKEHSGLDLRKLKFSFRLDGGRMAVSDLNISLPSSSVSINGVEASFSQKNGKIDAGSVRFNGGIDKSEITLNDISCFVPAMRGNTNRLYAETSFNGTGKYVDVEQLHVRSENSRLNLSANGYIGWRNKAVKWHANINDLTCSAERIGGIIESSAHKDAKIPEILTRLSQIRYQGKVSGAGNSITADGTLTSGIGTVTLKASKNGRHLSARVNTGGIDMSRLLDNKHFGMLATNISVSCTLNGKKITDVSVNGVFPRFDYNGYAYTNITAKGNYDNSVFSGSLSIDDPNGQITADGTVDMKQSMQTTDIKATVRGFDPAAMNLTQKWDGSKFDFDISTDTRVSRHEANLFKGNIRVSNFIMSSAENTYRLDSLSIIAENGIMAMNSDFGHAELIGEYKLNTIAQSFVNLIHSKLPTLCEAKPQSDNRFRLNVEINKTDWLTALFGVQLNLESPLKASLAVADELGLMRMVCHADKLTYNDSPYENITVTAGTSGDTLSVDGSIRKIMKNGHKLDLNLLANALGDKLTASISWDNNRKKPMAGQLNTETTFMKKEYGKSDINIDIKPSNILINDTVWNVLPSNIKYSGGDLNIENFAIEHNRQHIRINGLATRHTTDSITVDLQDVDINYMLNLINFHAVEFGGNMTGKAYVKSVFYEPDAYADLNINHFTFQHGRLGRLTANVRWDKTEKHICIDAHADDTGGARTTVQGYVSPAHNDIDLSIKAKDTNIEFLESFCDVFMDNIKGKANGMVRLHGRLNAIELSGEVVADGSTHIIPTNVTYTLANDTVKFMPGNIVFSSDTIRDRNGNIGIVNGALHHRHLKNLTYDISISTRNLLCYDTKSYDENTFYGTAYGTGTCNIQGQEGRIDIDVNITPGKNSFMEYNAATPEAISDQQFITWHDKTQNAAEDSTVHTESHASQPLPVDITSDMRINFLLNITPEVTLRVLMDKNTNDLIALNGSGTIRASYFNKGTFDMFGTFVIDHGVYTLTIQNIIKKIFQFQQGGTIMFGGSPYDALLDLQAIYTVNGVPLSDLQLGNSFSGNNVRVDCLMNISGTPQAPKVDFNIDMPTVNEDAEQMVRTVINSEEEMNQQVVYLLSVGRFYIQGNNNSSEQSQNQTSLAMQSLLSGTISQQINTLLGSLVKNNNWTFGANISTGDEGFNNAEYEGMLSGRLLNNRLLINGQFGYRDNENATTSFIGDFDINYLLRPNGNMALKVYNQTNDRYFTKSSLNTQGIGFILKKDFNSFLELFGINRKRDKIITEEENDSTEE